MQELNRAGVRARLTSPRSIRNAVNVFAFLICALTCSAGSAGVINPYHGIVERNVFGLKPPAPPAAHLPSVPLPKITLTGITTLFGKRALLKVEYPAQPNKPARKESLILAEGQRDEGIEVLQVDEKTSRVRLNNCGDIVEITFDKHPVANSIVNPQPSVRPPPVWTRAPVQGWARRY